MLNRLYAKLGVGLFYLLFPIGYLYLKNSKRTRILVHCGSDILIIRNWLSDGKYTLPGGGVKKGEQSEKGAVRELDEETGILVSPNKLSVLDDIFITNEAGISYECISYALAVSQKQDIRRLKREITDSAWVNPKDCLQNYQLTPTTRRLITTWSTQHHLLD